MGFRFRVKHAKQPAKKSLADHCSQFIGSWPFIGAQATGMFLWIFINTTSPAKFDKPPFVLLNLLLSFQAAFTGPVLLMAANRQSEVDRKRDIDHFLIDIHDSEVLENMAQQLEEIHRHVEVDNEHF